MDNPFNVIISGGRGYTDYATVCKVADKKLAAKHPHIQIVSGACPTGAHTYTRPDGTMVYGADGLGERYAAERGYPVIYFPADFKALGKKAGPMRNIKMAVFAHALIAFWDGSSNGTGSMVEAARGRSLKIHIHRVDIHLCDNCGEPYRGVGHNVVDEQFVEIPGVLICGTCWDEVVNN